MRKCRETNSFMCFPMKTDKVCGKLSASLWRVLPHSGRLGQIYVMWDDAATDATEPAGSTPEGELTGKPCSINSDALTNS